MISGFSFTPALINYIVLFMSFLLQHEMQIRMMFSLAGLAVFFLLGLLLPYRKSELLSKSSRWLTNILLMFANAFLIRALGLLGLITLSQFAATNTLGLFHFLDWHIYLEFGLGLLLLDAVIYWQHRVFHMVPIFWRLHRLHHSDVEFDATTAARFHPVEIVLSYMLKMLMVLVLGVSSELIIVFEIVLNFSAVFNHGNFHLPDAIERLVRPFIITPDLHRTHHSVLKRETDSNYGFFLSIWDRLFGSLLESPANDPQTMLIGIDDFRRPEQQGLFQLLKQPVK